MWCHVVPAAAAVAVRSLSLLQAAPDDVNAGLMTPTTYCFGQFLSAFAM
jgi:hypothetical protein